MVNYVGLERVQYGIEIVAGGVVYDLHNAAEFTGHVFDQGAQRLVLMWDYWDYDSNRVVSKITLTFDGVSSMTENPADPELPVEEGTCLEKITVDQAIGSVEVLLRSELGFKFKCTKVTFGLFSV